MALIICPECSKEISDKVNVCPHCGYPLDVENEKTIDHGEFESAQKNDSSKKKKIVFAIGLALILIVGLIILTMENEEHKTALMIAQEINSELNQSERQSFEITAAYSTNTSGGLGGAIEEGDTAIYLEHKYKAADGENISGRNVAIISKNGIHQIYKGYDSNDEATNEALSIVVLGALTGGNKDDYVEKSTNIVAGHALTERAKATIRGTANEKLIWKEINIKKLNDGIN